jgi:hypothetical protein
MLCKTARLEASLHAKVRMGQKDGLHIGRPGGAAMGNSLLPTPTHAARSAWQQITQFGKSQQRIVSRGRRQRFGR